MSEMNTFKRLTLFDQLRRLNFLMHRYHQMNHRQHGPMGDPHRGQGRVLTLLSLREEISQRDLTYLLDMRPQSLGELLIKLERGGYIERVPSEDDRRAMMVRITDAGKEAASQTERPDADGLFDCLTDGECEALSGCLDKVIAALESQSGMDGRDEAAFYARGRGEGRGGFPGFGPDGMRRDGGFRDLGGRGGMGCHTPHWREARDDMPDGGPERV